MPEQFPYPEEGWSTGRMRTRGEPLEDSPVRVAGMWDSIKNIFGFPPGEAKPTPEPTVTKTHKASPMGEYPTDADAEFAKSHGFGYGTIHEPYIDNKTAKVYGEVRTMTEPGKKGKPGTSTQSFYADSAAGKTITQILNAANDKARSVDIDLTKPEFKGVRDRIGHAYTKAAMAVENNAIAKLGYDPKLVMSDVSGRPTNLSGAYRGPNQGAKQGEEAIYANLTDPSVLVHESIHRGVQMLEKIPEAKKLLDQLPEQGGHEMLVRYMMVKYAGDPEKIAPTGRPDQQRNEAIRVFEDKYWGEKRTKAMEGLMKIAAEEIARKRPGGPR